MATSAFEERLSSKAYKTWLKAGLCLGFLKEGLCPFIVRESQTLYSNVLSNVRQSGTCGGPLPQCTTCTAQDIVWNNRDKKWKLNQCPVSLCHKFVTTIQQEHVSPKPRGMCWKNSNVQAWPSSHWEVAKTLMDTIEGGPMKTSPDECDCSSLLKFIEYSKVCQGKISTGDATKVRQHRNEIMHSSNMELSDADLRKFANDMITLLKSIGDYVTNTPAQTAVQHIEEARDTDIEITVGDEIRVLTETQQEIQNTVKKQFEDMRKLKNTLSDLETKTAGKTEEHGKELKELSGIAQEHRKGMEKLERETEERLGKQEHEVGRLTETMEDTEERLKKQEDRVGRLTETMEDTGERLKKQEDRMGRLTETMEDSGEDMKKTTKEMSADIEKLKRELEEKLNYIKSIEGRLQKLESPKTTSERAATDLQGFLLDHYREKFSSIPVSPMFSKKTVPLESLFTELVVVEDIDKGLGQMPQRGQKEEREVPVSSYKDIFHKDDKTMKDIYLIAEGGAGKTVSCKQIVNTWVRTHEQQQVVGWLNHNETVMNGFKYLFFVPLREVSGKTDLIDAVCECLTDQASIKTMIRSVFDTSPNEVLVVLDGLDEVKVIPGRHPSHSYTILTTTRPWKFDIVQQSHHLEVDRLLKLKGLDDERIPELIDKVLENCYDDTTKVARENIQTNIKSHGLMTSARIPLILVSLIHMCHEQKSLSPSLTRTMQDIIDCIIECNMKKIQSRGLYPAPEQVAQPLKGINDEECSLLKYRGIIMALSKLAFYALINEDKENSLVFSKKSLRKYFSENDLELCLNLGLLSKREEIGYLKKKEKVVISFPHKVFQEWFAALCVVNDTEAFTKLKQYLMSTETILDMSNVFAFVCGMCGESASGLTKRVMEICTSSPDIQHFRTTARSSSIVERLTDMYIRCAIECETTGQVGTTVLYISDIQVYLSEDTVNNDMYQRAVSYLIDTNASRLTAVSLHNSIFQSVPQVIREALCNHTFDSLQKLYVLDVDVAVVNSMLTNNPGIQVLVVWYWGRSSVGLCLPLLQQLQHLELWGFPVTRDFLQQLSALGQLRSLYLRWTDIGDHYLDLSSLTHLTTLTLCCITMTSSVWQGMLQTMNTLQSLQVLELGDIALRGDTRSGTTTQMSTRFMSQLQELKCTLCSPQVYLPLLLGLHDASSLRSLVIEGDRVPTEQVTMNARAIPHLYQLEKLKLGYIDFPDQQLSLKYNTKLQKLILTSVQLSPTSWQHLFDSLQSLPHLNNIKLYDVKISLDDVRLPNHLVITSHHNSVIGAGRIDVECKQI